MDLVLLAVAAVWGGATGLLIPRAAYRFAVEPEEPWRTACPAGHPFTGPLGGWWGPARCLSCASRAQASVRYGDEAEAPASRGEKAEAPVPRGEESEASAPHGEESEAPAPHAEETDAPAPYGGKPPAPLSYAYAPGTLVPLIAVLACLALAAATGPRPELAVWLLLAPPAVLLATVDRRVHRLPDPLTLPLAAAAVLLLGGAALLPGHAGSWTSGLLGGLVLGGFYLLLFLINPNGMGFGDVKLALALGVALGWYGWEVLFLGGFAGFLFGAAYGLGLVLLRRAGRKTGIPFGPFMIAGALTGVLLGALAA
ncbi:prepilin peptidase [Streptomyces cyaneofuscatus]|uniref:Prepilin peptidase n=1 Tax=Streptomyces cyaneofuscatus TaxID=66883 RepID=A0ABZ1F0Z9_9ACTN|nr:prepilin peptidase [Streptomyces cyaneofuscatus]WSB10058.1 prepilin peptidase [Streptomyces cyaneofuscatus]WSD46409.1 prepilin peptidase [Streptomyces cyaneofuscatus]WTA89787.1 prepilin peptidase [Streptomyces cyaneofuscatus]